MNLILKLEIGCSWKWQITVVINVFHSSIFIASGEWPTLHDAYENVSEENLSL